MHNNNITFSTKQFPSPSIPSFILFFIIYNKIPLLSLSPRKPSLPLHSRTIVTLFYLFFSPRPPTLPQQQKNAPSREDSDFGCRSQTLPTRQTMKQKRKTKNKKDEYILFTSDKNDHLFDKHKIQKNYNKNPAHQFLLDLTN